MKGSGTSEEMRCTIKTFSRLPPGSIALCLFCVASCVCCSNFSVA